MRERKQDGFSLIELLIVVAIILIIAAIAIPNLMKSRLRSNDAAAAAAVRTINTAEAGYTTSYPTAGFATIPQLGPGGTTCSGTGGTSANACLLDGTLGCTTSWCVKDAFWYNVTLTTGDYTVTAVPINGQGDIVLCSNGDMVIHVQTPAAINAANGATAPSGGLAHDACSALPAQ